MKKIITYLILALILSMSSLSQINEFKVLPSDGNTKDLFGSSVAISENYAIVGAPHSNDSTGAAYVFGREGSNWIEEQKLIARDGANGDGFGRPLSTASISGDRVIIGAPYDDSSKGSAYIFKKEGLIWIEEKKLLASDGIQGDRFGTSVSLSGNYLVIGAPNNDSSGAAYVFRLEGSNWIEEQKLKATDGIQFSTSVSISGNYLIIGSPGSDRLKGSAYIFKREGTSWLEEQKLVPNTGDTSIVFGFSVAVSGDYAVVGTPWSRVNGISSGTAYVFKREETNWVEEQKIVASDGANSDWFGLSVSISDGYIIVGAHYNDDNGSASGSAYIFSQQGTTWVEEQKLTASDADTGDTFGVSVAISGDYAIVGAHCNDDNGENSGSAYIFTGFIVGVENDISENPLSFRLGQNYPNPFNPSTTIKYSIPQTSNAVIKIYDVLGNEIETLVSEEKPVGTYEITWYAENLSSGIYFYRLQAGDFIETKKMVLIK